VLLDWFFNIGNHNVSAFTKFQALLDEFKFKELFVEELGWDNPTPNSKNIRVDGYAFALTQIMHKHDVAIFRCSPDAIGEILQRPSLLKIEKETTKIAYTHLLVLPIKTSPCSPGYEYRAMQCNLSVHTPTHGMKEKTVSRYGKSSYKLFGH
jgi:hypothetical protein